MNYLLHSIQLTQQLENRIKQLETELAYVEDSLETARRILDRLGPLDPVLLASYSVPREILGS